MRVNDDDRLLSGTSAKSMAKGQQRCSPPPQTPEMWPGLMAAAKAAGIDVITTYVFWNVHEIAHDPATDEVTYDFKTGRLNLAAFLQAAQDAGLFVFVRLGPFTCAEWTYGGA